MSSSNIVERIYEEKIHETIVNDGYLPEDLVLAARREEIDWVQSEGVYEIVPLQFGWTQTCLWTPTRKIIRSRLCAREYKTRKQGKIQRTLPASQLFSAMPPLEAVREARTRVKTCGLTSLTAEVPTSGALLFRFGVD